MRPFNTLFFGVAVEPGNRAQPAGNRGRCLTPGFQLSCVRLDVGPSDIEKTQLVVVAEHDELPKIQGVGVTGEAPVASEEPGNGNVGGICTLGVVDNDGGRWRPSSHSADSGAPGLPGDRSPPALISVTLVARRSGRFARAKGFVGYSHGVNRFLD